MLENTYLPSDQQNLFSSFVNKINIIINPTQTKPLPTRLDNRHKFYAILEQLQLYLSV